MQDAAVINNQPLSVDYAVTCGTASQKSDYTYVAGTVRPDTGDNSGFAATLAFAPGEKTRVIEITRRA